MDILKNISILLAATCSLSSAEMTLRQLHIITRQGSSTTVLDGSIDEPMQILSSVGRKQLFNLGVWIRQEFSNVEGKIASAFYDVNKPEGFFEQYSPPRFLIESSASDTPIISAQSLANGMFPAAADRVPIYTQSDRNDVTIDSESRCPFFTDEIETSNLQTDLSWDEMETSFMNLLKRLATIPAFDSFVTGSTVSDESEFRYVPLEEVKRVYDIIREAKLTCEQGYDSFNIDTCAMLPFSNTASILTEAEWGDLKELAKYTEVRTKYGTERAAKLLGGNLLKQMMSRMLHDEMNEPTDKSSKRVYVTSADYPTLIAVMKALNIEQDDALVDEAFPGYGSALIFELLQDTDSSEHSIRILYKAAGRYNAVVLRPGGLCYASESCRMLSFSSQVQQVILKTSDWCRECGNDISDVCMWTKTLTAQQQLQDEMAKEDYILQNNITVVDSPSAQSVYNVAEGGPQQIAPEKSSSCRGQHRESLRDDFIGFFFGGLLAGVVLTCVILALANFIRKCRRRRRNNENSSSPGKDSIIRPKTPSTVLSSPPVLASPLRRKPRWSPKCPRSPMANVSLDADSLALDDEDEDHSVHLDDFEEGLYLPDTEMAPPAPGKGAFPPSIV